VELKAPMGKDEKGSISVLKVRKKSLVIAEDYDNLESGVIETLKKKGVIVWNGHFRNTRFLYP
jgi:hypothetical protein